MKNMIYVSFIYMMCALSTIVYANDSQQSSVLRASRNSTFSIVRGVHMTPAQRVLCIQSLVPIATGAVCYYTHPQETQAMVQHLGTLYDEAWNIDYVIFPEIVSEYCETICGYGDTVRNTLQSACAYVHTFFSRSE